MTTHDKSSILKILKNEASYLQTKFGVLQIGLFGSFARGIAGENSDVDIIVSLAKPLGFEFIQLADYLEDKLGRKVDLITSSTLKAGFEDPRRSHIARNIEETLEYV